MADQSELEAILAKFEKGIDRTYSDGNNFGGADFFDHSRDCYNILLGDIKIVLHMVDTQSLVHRIRIHVGEYDVVHYDMHNKRISKWVHHSDKLEQYILNVIKQLAERIEQDQEAKRKAEEQAEKTRRDAEAVKLQAFKERFDIT